MPEHRNPRRRKRANASGGLTSHYREPYAAGIHLAASPNSLTHVKPGWHITPKG